MRRAIGDVDRHTRVDVDDGEGVDDAVGAALVRGRWRGRIEVRTRDRVLCRRGGRKLGDARDGHAPAVHRHREAVQRGFVLKHRQDARVEVDDVLTPSRNHRRVSVCDLGDAREVDRVGDARILRVEAVHDGLKRRHPRARRHDEREARGSRLGENEPGAVEPAAPQRCATGRRGAARPRGGAAHRGGRRERGARHVVRAAACALARDARDAPRTAVAVVAEDQRVRGERR